jgi:hypothetical protein
MSTFNICENGIIREATPEEAQQFIADRAANLVRKRFLERESRDQLLAQTDWTQTVDVPQATKDKWAPYRQALRDVPQQAGFPDNIQWPSKPE